MEKRETTVIGTINGTDICAITDNGEVFVPIKPICTAIGVNYPTQIDKISKDPILSSVPLGGIVAGDNKEREMLCLPLMYVYGWLFTINPDRVKPEARVLISHGRWFSLIHPWTFGMIRRRGRKLLKIFRR